MAEEQQSGRLGRWEKQPEPGDAPQNRLKATHSNPIATTTAYTNSLCLDEDGAVEGERRVISTSGLDVRVDDGGTDQATKRSFEMVEKRSRYGPIFTRGESRKYPENRIFAVEGTWTRGRGQACGCAEQKRSRGMKVTSKIE